MTQASDTESWGPEPLLASSAVVPVFPGVWALPDSKARGSACSWKPLGSSLIWYARSAASCRGESQEISRAR